MRLSALSDLARVCRVLGEHDAARHHFAQALDSENAEVRKNAVEGIQRLGDVRGVKILIWKLEAHGATGQRVYASFINQLTYIQDFDVEVAQTAFIADPQVAIL